MLVRKRTSFKPNLKQIAPTASTTPATTTPPTPPTAATTSNAAGSQPAGSFGGAPAPPADSAVASQPAGQVAPIGSANDHTGGLVIADLQAAQTHEPAHSTTTTKQTTPNSNNIPTQNQQQPQPPPAPSNTNHDADPSSAANRRVQEAITMLKGQKFEPIKSLSLRTSVNKNVKLKDLLFFNPPMTKDQKRHKKTIHSAKRDDKLKAGSKRAGSEQPETATATTLAGSGQSAGDADQGSDEQASLVPKVKMGPGGKLVLDESSTVINRTNAIKEQEAIVEDHEDIISKTNYDSYRRKPSITSQTKWSLEDTKKFYRALTILGTDFSVMESLLFAGSRSRTELHKKFKREERVNKPKVDIALSNRISLNSEELEDLKEIFSK